VVARAVPDPQHADTRAFVLCQEGWDTVGQPPVPKFVWPTCLF
jgi:hypothetical protein